VCLKPGHLIALLIRHRLRRRGPICKAMRIERRRSKPGSAAARSSGVHAQPITNLQALQTESIVPSQFHRRENGSPWEVRKVRSGPPSSRCAANRFGRLIIRLELNWSKFVVASRL